MSRTLYKFFAVAVAISMIVALPAVAMPQSEPAVSYSASSVPAAAVVSQPAPSIAQPQPEVAEPGGDIELPEAALPKTGPAKVVIELADEPATVTYAAAQTANKSAVEATAAVHAQLAQIESAQQALLSELDQLGAKVIYRTQRVYNGIAAIVDAEQLDQLAQQPGVKAIHPLVTKSLDNWNSVPLIGAPQLWDQGGMFGGLDGSGIKVGVIDTGIDYMHANFGGPATQGAYEANDTTVVTDTYNSQLLYPTLKVVGGWDFAGDAYDANSDNTATYNPIPVPDPDPADCGDHGSHVAGTVAGFGVNANGTTYTGSYKNDLNFSQFKIGPGVAPKAELYALRVFGCAGSTDLTDQAIEWATDPNGDGDFSDHLDVINMSLGSSYGSIYDSSAVAADNAALAGVVVVMSSGNSGDVHYVTGSPGIAARGISVAGTDDGAAILDGFKVIAPDSRARVYPASQSVRFNWAGSTLPMTGTLVYPLPGSNPAQDQRTGCYTYDITNTQIIAGNFVLQDWNEPSCLGSVGRADIAQAAGAIGVIMVDNSGAFDLFITGSYNIPAYSAPKSVGDALKAALGEGAVQLVMTNQYKGSVPYNESDYQNTIYSSSSRGPRRGDSLLKPDIAAPAVSVFSTQNAWPWSDGKGDGTTGVSYNGTSMAAPHVAGSMALLKQLHPGWSVEELKSLAMNTATTDVTQANGAAPKYTPARVGAGRITLPNAASSDVIAFNATEPYLTSVSFGAVEVNGTAEVTKQIKVVNKGSQPARYTVGYAGYAEVPGVQYTVTPAQINLPAWGSALVTVRMTANAAQMKHTADPTLSTAGGRSWLTEASGYVVLTPVLPTYTLSLNAVGNGTINVEPAGGVYVQGTVVTLTAVADPHWSFVNWSGGVTGSINPLVITMDGNKSITANFAQDVHPLTVHLAGNGSGLVTREPDAASYAYGTVITLTAVPTTTSYFAGWSGDVTSTANPVSLTIDGNRTVTATFSTHLFYMPLVAKSATGAVRATAQPVEPAVDGVRVPTVLRVPVHAAPRPASNMDATVAAISFANITGTATIPLAGTAISNGLSYPTDIVSLVSGFELAEASPNDPGYPGTDNADLKHVGVTNNNRVAAGGFVTDTVVYFGVSTWGNHNTAYAGDAEFDIYIDSNRDGNPDYVVYNTQSGSDVYRTAVYNISTRATVVDRYVNVTAGLDTYPFNNNVMILPVSASRLGLNNSNPRFDYQVVAFSREEPTGAPVDVSAVHTYSAAAAGLDFTNGSATDAVWFDLPGTNVNVNFNQAAYVANGSQGALLLHHHNAMGAREEVISVTLPTNYAVVSLMHTNDFHGNLDTSPGFARLATVVKQVRNEVNPANVALFDAGDEMQGNLLSNLYYGASTIDLFNFLGYQAATVGNHEFDWKQQELISRTNEARYPFVVSNIVSNTTGNCATETGWTPPTGLKMRPWYTMTVGAPGNQVMLGIIGVTTQETPYITMVENTAGLCFKDPATSITHYYDDVKNAGAQVIVILSHLGYPDGGYGYLPGLEVYGDQTLARKLVQANKPAHLIIGGHSHTDLQVATVVSGTTIVQANNAGLAVGRADLSVNKTSGAVAISWRSLPVTTAIPQDAATLARINSWKTPAYNAKVGQVIGWSNVDMVRNRYADPALTPGGESLLSNFVNDAVYNYLNTDGTTANDVDMVMNNSGGMRADLTSATKPFSLTYGSLFSVLPFGNQTVVGRLTGAQIMELLNQSALIGKGVLQTSGIRYSMYSYTDTLPGPQPWAFGAMSVTVYNKGTLAWEPISMTQYYNVATNEFLAPAGQDGFLAFKYMTGTVPGTKISYWGDMLDGVIDYVSRTYTSTTPYSATLDGRLFRLGTAAGGPVIPVTVLHHNDSHGRLLQSGSTPGYTNLATAIKQQRAHNPDRTILLTGGDNIQGDTMMAYYKTSYTGKASDGTTLPVTLTMNPLIKAFNAMTYTAMTLGNHEFNFGNAIFTNTLKQANFSMVQANLYDTGAYGLAQVPVQSDVTATLADGIKVAVLGVGNHRVPQYEMAIDIPGLTFTNPITEAATRAPVLEAANDVVVALTHIGFTEDPASVEVDLNVDTNLAAQTTGIDAVLGAHSHTPPYVDPKFGTGNAALGSYKYLPNIAANLNGEPVIINQANRYNTVLGQIVLGLRPRAGGGYEVVSRAGRDIELTTAAYPEDAAVKAIVKPYDDFLTAYKNQTFGRTSVPLDTTNAFITETNGANLQADASLWKLNKELSATLTVDFHLSGAMTNAKVAASATVANPYTMTVGDMFSLMPYENALVVFSLNGPQLKTLLERGYRNYWYYKYTANAGGYSKYTTCMLDISAGGIITYTNNDPATYNPAVDHIGGLSYGNTVVDFTDATQYYNVSTVNYIAAGSCNFNNGGVTMWPMDQLQASTQYYVRDVVIEYVPTLAQPIAPLVENRLRGIP